jgi:hypothetical protein
VGRIERWKDVNIDETGGGRVSADVTEQYMGDYNPK